MTFYYIGMYEIITYIHVYPINILSRFKVLDQGMIAFEIAIIT